MQKRPEQPFRVATASGSEPEGLVRQLAAALALPPESPESPVPAAPGTADAPEDSGSRVRHGFLFVSDSLARHATALLEGLRAATGVTQWTGGTGMAILGGTEEFYETPSLVAMVGEFPAEEVRVIAQPVQCLADLVQALEGFLTPEEPGRLILHAAPNAAELEPLLQEIEQQTAWFAVGGVSSGQAEVVQFANGVVTSGVVGLALRDTVPLAVRHSQGCSPLPGQHVLTETWRNIIVRLDDRPALSVFKEVIGEVLARDLRRSLGYIHIGLPIPRSDTKDYRVRNIIGIDLDRELLAVGEDLEAGKTVLFVRRDGQAAREDLERMVHELRQQCAATGIRGGLYVSCLGRGRYQFGSEGAELGMIQAILGDIPLVGFFANGEIFANRLYGYTGVLVLF